MPKFSAEMKIVDALKAHPEAKKVLANYQLICEGCGGAAAESLRQAARNHGLLVETLLKELNALADHR
jgi:hybrid cluster-associated redox disulfide protein